MSASVHVRLAWALLMVSMIAWPITAWTVFRGEPQGILGLSFLAIILTALDVIATTTVHAKQEEES